MIAPLSFLLLTSVALTSARPLVSWTVARREVASLNQAATAEAQQRDDTATRAFTAQEIQTSDGKCLAVDPLSGDFRENLTPVQIVACNGTDGQKWDVITSGKHNNVQGQALVVSSLTNACLNFDPRRAAGNQVLLFSCGGRADGGGQVTNSQLFAFNGFNGPFQLQVNNSAGTCMTSANGALLDQASCDNSAAQTFTIAGAEGGAAPTSSSAESSTVVEVAAASSSSTSQTSASSVAQASSASSAAPTTTAVATTTAAASSADNGSASQSNPSATVTVSRAGGVLNPSAAAEANPRDNTATRAFSSVSLKSSDGQCLFIDPSAGDFRENLIPVQLKACDGSDNEKFDIITAGAHDNVANSALVTQGCLNFDPRRAAGDTVIMFSCGGRADGGGQTTNSQLFPLPVGKTILLAPQNANNATCLVPNGNLLDESNCTGSQDQVFTIA